MDLELLVEFTDAKIPDWGALGYEYVIIYRFKDEKANLVGFVEGYKNYYQVGVARQYWKNAGYVVRKFYDLDYTDYLAEQR